MRSPWATQLDRRPWLEDDEPDEWRDAEDERYSDEAHEPKERT